MYLSGHIMGGIYTRGSWLTVSYHFVSYFYIKTMICLPTIPHPQTRHQTQK